MIGMPTPTTSPSRGAILTPSTLAAAAVVKLLEVSVDVPLCETAVAVTRYCVPGTSAPVLSQECDVGSSEPTTVSPFESATDTAVSVPSATETETCELSATAVAPSAGATVSWTGGDTDGEAGTAGALLVGAPATCDGRRAQGVDGDGAFAGGQRRQREHADDASNDYLQAAPRTQPVPPGPDPARAGDLS